MHQSTLIFANHKHFYHFAHLCLIVLFFLTLSFLSPTCLSHTHAETPSSSTATLSSISLALDQELILDITPTASGNIGTTSGNVTVSTSSNAGYKLYLDTIGSTANLTNVDPAKSQSRISALATPTSLTNLPVNTWGFALTTNPADADTDLSGPQDSTSPLITTSSAATDHYYFTLAANIDTSLPAGQYANTLLLSAIANPETITGLRAITYMQDMTSSICQASAENDTKQLIDSRDNQSYWVAKLKDGNCWMTQNLALNLKASNLLAAGNSDIPANWAIPTNTNYAIPPASTSYSPTDYRSWNLGTYVLATPLSATPCETTTGILTSGKTLSSCSNFQDVKDWQPTFTAQPGSWKGKEYDFVAVDETSKTYDAHYLIGKC